jgi:hypothetical protein
VEPLEARASRSAGIPRIEVPLISGGSAARVVDPRQ